LILKPQDLVVILKLALAGRASQSYAELAVSLAMSPSEVHQAVRRARAAGLVVQDPRQERERQLTGLVVNRQALLEFVLHGMRYAFIAERGGETRGMPTAYAAPPLRQQIVAQDPLPPVWPDPQGSVRGLQLTPLYRTVPRAAAADPAL
jgi:DNA-binding Lrp family transcriptional regulator